ncbi:MAG: signal peptidase I [Stackebrandtia sp.]
MTDTRHPAVDTAPEGDRDDAEAQPKPGSFWRELPVLLVVATVVALLVRTFVLQSFWIPSGSMENTLERGDRVLVNKLVYDFFDPDRGEVVVFKAPAEWRANPEDEDFIKRVIAVGGDTVSYDADAQAISVNGYELDESAYLYEDSRTGQQDPPSKDDFEFTVTVPQGRLWVMGDHRSASGDSRENYIRGGGDLERATIPVDSVVGRAFVLMWPVDRWDWMSTPEVFDSVPDTPPDSS